MEETLKKRSSNCSGCGIENSQHTCGLPSRYCEGKVTAVEPDVRTAETTVDVGTNILPVLSYSDDEAEEKHLQKELQELQSQREELEKRHRQAELRAKVDRERHALADLQERIRAFDVAANSEGPQGQHFQQQHNRATATNAARMTAATLRNSAPENSLLPPTPLDALLADLPRGSSWSEQVGAQRPLNCYTCSTRQRCFSGQSRFQPVRKS